jgi:hypothetical protein
MSESVGGGEDIPYFVVDGGAGFGLCILNLGTPIERIVGVFGAIAIEIDGGGDVA